MDSVITQVSQESSGNKGDGTNNNGGAESSNSNSNSSSSGGGDQPAVSSQQAAAATLSNSTKEPKKRSRRNFLCSVICCFGRRSSSRRKKSGKESPDSLGAVGLQTQDAGDGRGAAGSGASGSGAGVSSAVGTVSGAGAKKALLPELRREDEGKMCIVIDLDETLVHSSFKPISNADFIVPVEIDGTIHQVYVLKRPHVDEFLCRMGELYECILFTASLAKYADPVADLLDKWDVFRSRLFRESCVFHRGNYVKDLSRLGRDLQKIVIVDNSPASYIFHPDNAVPCSSWFDDMNDRELLDLIPFLENLSQMDSVYAMLAAKFKQGNNGSSTGAPVSPSSIVSGSNNGANHVVIASAEKN